MELILFFYGLAIGILIAIPIGPVAILCIQRTLIYNRKTGLISALGAATADTVFGAIAGFAVMFGSGILARNQVYLRLIGSLVVIFLGAKVFLSKLSRLNQPGKIRDLIEDYFSTFFATITNPTPMLALAAIFAGFGVVEFEQSYLAVVVLAFGVGMGVFLWWVFVTKIIAVLKGKFSIAVLEIVNKAAGLVIMGFGVVSLLVVMRKLM